MWKTAFKRFEGIWSTLVCWAHSQKVSQIEKGNSLYYGGVSLISQSLQEFQADSYMLRVENKNNRLICSQCSKLPFQSSVEFHVENSYLLYRPKQMTGFYMKQDTGLTWVNNNETRKRTIDFALTNRRIQNPVKSLRWSFCANG